jgi:hypothetical protein
MNTCAVSLKALISLTSDYSEMGVRLGYSTTETE